MKKTILSIALFCTCTLWAKVDYSWGRNIDACTEDYAPVCGEVAVVCISAPCNPIKQTFSNICELKKETKATFLYEGKCTDINSSLQKELDKNIALWKSHNITDYSFLLNAYIGEPMKQYIYVKNNKMSDNIIVTGSGYFFPHDTLTINSYFDKIQKIITENSPLHNVIIEYDTHYGYPTKIGISVKDPNMFGGWSHHYLTKFNTNNFGCDTEEIVPICGNFPYPDNCDIKFSSPQTFPNQCTLDKLNAHFLYKGKCTN